MSGPHPALDGTNSEGVVLLVDDDVLLCELQQRWLVEHNYEVHTVHDGESCLTALGQVLPDVICLDLMMPGLDGLETLRRVKQHHPHLPVIVMTASTAVEPAVDAMKLGAYDYLEKPVTQPKLIAEIRNTVERHRLTFRLSDLEREVSGKGYAGIVGSSPRMKALFRRLDRVAASDITVLIHGESGTGKELVARAIHEQSARRGESLVTLSCAAIPESLQESELFGHERGAFTGATQRRLGAFERADRGTLFLDEIGELSPSLQAKLLRVLQERTFQRVGGSGEIPSDFRLVAATHRDLAAEVRDGRFREDLYFRVAVMELELPPLRDRPGDIPLLTEHLLRRIGQRQGVEALALDPRVPPVLLQYAWPGNVRELENALERAAVESPDGVVRVAGLPRRMGEAPPARVGPHPTTSTASRTDDSQGSDLASPVSHPPAVRTLEQMERDAIVESLGRNRGNMSQVVRELGIGRTTLYRKLKKYNLR